MSTSGASSRLCWPAARSILVIHLAAMVFFNHVLPNAEAQEIRGPLHAINYLDAGACLLGTDDRLSGAASLLRSASGRAGRCWSSCCRWPIVLVDGLLPVGVVAELARPADQRRADVDRPAGFRWLNETWLKVDRGVRFYNNEGHPTRSRLSDQPSGLCGPGIAGRWPGPPAFRGDAARREASRGQRGKP